MSRSSDIGSGPRVALRTVVIGGVLCCCALSILAVSARAVDPGDGVCQTCAPVGEVASAPSSGRVATGTGGGGISMLWDTSDFPARWHCGTWSPAHGWTHIIADFMIFGAYAAIPIALVYFIRRRADIPFPKIFWLFCLFIFACGTGHLIESTLFWWPWYRLSAAMKVLTAVVSWATVIALIPILPKALALPGLERVNEDLRREVDERRSAEEAASTKAQELERFMQATLGREMRVVELKREVNELAHRLGESPRYRAMDASPPGEEVPA